MSDSILWHPPVIAKREPSLATPLTIANNAMSATKCPTGAEAGSVWRASIDRFTVQGIVSDASVAVPRQAMPMP